VPTGNSEANIRSVDVYLGARSSQSVQQANKTIYARSNLMTQVSLRSLATSIVTNRGAGNEHEFIQKIETFA